MTLQRTIIACLMPFLTVAAMLWATSCSHAQAVPVNTSFLNWRTINSKQVNSSLIVQPPIKTLTLEIALPTWDAPTWLQVDQSADGIHWTPLLTNAVQAVINPKVTLIVTNGGEVLRLFRFGVRTNL